MAIAQSKRRISGLGILAEIDVITQRHKKDLSQKLALPLEAKTRSALIRLGVKNPSQTLVNRIVFETTRNTANSIAQAKSTSDFTPIIASKFTESALQDPEVAQKNSDSNKIYDIAQEETADVVADNSKDLERAAVLGNLQEISKLQNPTAQTQEIITNSADDSIRIQAPLMPPDEAGEIKEALFAYASVYPQKIAEELPNLSTENLPTLAQLQEAKDAAHNKSVAEVAQNIPDNIHNRIDFKDLAADVGEKLNTKKVSPGNFSVASPKKAGIADFWMKQALKMNPKAQEEAYYSLLAYNRDRLERAVAENKNTPLFRNAQNFAAKNPKKITQYLIYYQNLYGADRSSVAAWEATSVILRNPGSLSQGQIPGQVIGAITKTGGGVSGIRNTLNTAQTALKAGKLAVGASNPLGWAMLAYQYRNLLKKIAAAVGAFIGWLIFTAGLKLLGLAAGIAFGALSGIPFAFIPGVGPILYGGWVTYWGAKGWIDPLDTLNTFRHPLSIFEGPAGFLHNIWSGLGNSASLAANGFVGGVSSAWGGLTNLATGSFGAIGSGINSLFSALSAGSVPTAAVAGVVFGVPAGIAILGITGFISINSAFFSTAEGILNVVPGQNEFYVVTKTANPPHLENKPADQTKNIAFTITLTPKKIRLTSVQVSDNMTIQNKDGPVTPLPQAKDNNGNNLDLSKIPCPAEIPPDGYCLFNFSIPVDQTLNDSLITNTVNVEAKPEGQEVGKKDTASTIVTVGNPPIPNCGSSSSFARLLPNPIPASVGTVSSGSLSTLISGNVINVAKIASSQTGVPCEMLVGIDYIEAGWLDTGSFISGRQIGATETDINNPSLCSSLGGTFSGGGCTFSSLQQTALASANIILNKMATLTGQRRPPANFNEMIGAMSYYNGGGNSNCGKSVPYNNPCPPPAGIDDPYAMGHFDSKHPTMYLIYCADLTKCSTVTPFTRDGAATAAKEFFLRIGAHQ